MIECLSPRALAAIFSSDLSKTLVVKEVKSVGGGSRGDSKGESGGKDFCTRLNKLQGELYDMVMSA